MTAGETAFDRFYHFAAIILCILLVLSPVLRSFTGLHEYDRYLDGLALSLLVVRGLELTRVYLPRRYTIGGLLIAGFVLVSGAVNQAFNPYFNSTLLLIDSKLLVFIALALAFSNRPIADENRRKSISKLLMFSFVAAIVVFILVDQGNSRLLLLDESNYMILALIIVSVSFVDVFGLRVLSVGWMAVMAVLGVAALYAESRTGFALIAMLGLAMLFRARKWKSLLLAAWVLAMLGLALGEELIAGLLRNQTSLGDIDRFVFLQEVVGYWQRNSWFNILFGNHVGSFISDRPVLMEWWSQKLSAQQGIPYGLAPFHLHSAYLRMFTDFGVIPTLAMLWWIYRVLRRSLSGYVVAAVFISAISMSVFYLSAVIPFIVVAQWLRPRVTQINSEYALSSYKTQKYPQRRTHA